MTRNNQMLNNPIYRKFYEDRLAQDGKPQHLVEQEAAPGALGTPAPAPAPVGGGGAVGAASMGAPEDAPPVSPDATEDPLAGEEETGAEAPGDGEALPPPEGEEPAPEDAQTPPPPKDESFVPKIVEYMDMLLQPKMTKEQLTDYLKGIGPQAKSSSERSFVDSNLSSLSLLEETVVEEIRKKLKKEKEPEMLMIALEEALDSYPEMAEALQRLSAAGPDKSNLWRQLVAALCNGAVIPGVVGGEVHCPRGKGEEPMVLRPICTLNWGYVDLGSVRITATSPEDYLSDESRQRLTNGAPEERRVLRNRVFVESVADQLGGGYYMVLAIKQDDPNWDMVGFSSDIFRESYEGGLLTVMESMPGLAGSLAVDKDGQWVTMTTWRMASINQDEVGVDMETGAQKPKFEIISELQGDRFIWVGDADAFNAIGAKVGKRVFKQNDTEKAEQLRQSIPDARERLMGRRK